jgi:endonuclease/exonuclease/phosphatase family metal-dependent hydrolase
MGVKEDKIQVENWDTDTYFVGATIRHRVLNIRWDILIVYGPADRSNSGDFLEELGKRCEEANLPLLIWGDTNLIRKDEDKSSGVGNVALMNAFNSFIERFSSREVHMEGPKFTWTNKHECPIMSNIDRVSVTTEWDLKFSLASLPTLMRLGSDHCPMILDTRVKGALRQKDNSSLKNSGARKRGSII